MATRRVLTCTAEKTISLNGVPERERKIGRLSDLLGPKRSIMGAGCSAKSRGGARRGDAEEEDGYHHAAPAFHAIIPAAAQRSSASGVATQDGGESRGGDRSAGGSSSKEEEGEAPKSLPCAAAAPTGPD